jgi:hypothetical protein
MLRGRAAPRWLWITPVPDDDIIRKKNLTFNRAGIECTLSDHVFCLDNGEGLNLTQNNLYPSQGRGGQERVDFVGKLLKMVVENHKDFKTSKLNYQTIYKMTNK